MLPNTGVKQFLQCLLYPFRAVISLNFYYYVLFIFKGIGFVYLLLLCAAVALIASFKVYNVLQNFKDLELSLVVAKIPPSFVSPSGTMSPKDPTQASYLSLTNSKGQSVIVYNPNNEELESTNVPIVLSPHAMLVRGPNGYIEVPWTAIYGQAGGDIEPLATSQILAETVESSIVTIWLVVTIWIFSSASLMVLLSSLATKVVMSQFFKLSIGMPMTFRICAYATSLNVFFMLLQFFVNIYLSYLVLCFVPAVYSIIFLRSMVREISKSVASPSYALNPKNPMAAFFEFQSRITPEGKLDLEAAPYASLSRAEQQVREQRLAAMFKYSQNRIFLDRGSLFNYFQNGYPFEGSTTTQDGFTSEQEIEQMDSTTHSPSDHEPTSPYEFNRQQGADDPIFTERESESESSSVQTKGKDTSFMP